MSRIASVLAAVDFSDDARAALARAGALAAALGARLDVVHVVDAEVLAVLRRDFGSTAAAERRLVEELQRLLNAQAAAAPAGTQPAAHVAVGSVLDEILAAAAGHDLLVLGAHGLNRLRDMLIGTTAARLLARSPVPVLVVKRPPAGAYRRALVPLDASSDAPDPLPLALQVAPEAELTVVHALHVPGRDTLWLAGVAQEHIDAHSAQARERAAERIAARVRAAGAQDRAVRTVIEPDDAAPLILAQQAALDADLIVMGKRDRSRASELLLGSVTRRVLSAAACDVLVVPA
ncbi:MAG TPA: universal stress protein [Burkholderiales bacterium]